MRFARMAYAQEGLRSKLGRLCVVGPLLHLGATLHLAPCSGAPRNFVQGRRTKTDADRCRWPGLLCLFDESYVFHGFVRQLFPGDFC